MNGEVKLKIVKPTTEDVFVGTAYCCVEKTFYIPLTGGPWIADDEFMTAREELYEKLEELGVDPDAVTVFANPITKAEDWAQHVCDYVLDGEASTTELYMWPQPVTEPGMCYPVIRISLNAAIKLFRDAKERIASMREKGGVEPDEDEVNRRAFNSDLAEKYSTEDMEAFVGGVLARYLRINGYDSEDWYERSEFNWDTFTSSVYEMEFHGDTVEQCTAKITHPELIPQSLMADVQRLCDEFCE